MDPTALSLCKPFDNTMLHKTSDNSDFKNNYKISMNMWLAWGVAGNTHEHEQAIEPTSADRKLCVKLYSKRIRSCGLIDEWKLRQWNDLHLHVHRVLLRHELVRWPPPFVIPTFQCLVWLYHLLFPFKKQTTQLLCNFLLDSYCDLLRDGFFSST